MSDSTWQRAFHRAFVSILALMVIASIPAPTNAADIRVDSVFLVLIEDIDVPARENGVLNAMPVKEGQHVKVGDILAEIESKEAKLTRTRVELDLEIARKQAANKLPLQLANKAANESAAKLLQSEFELQISLKEEENDINLQFARKSAEVAKSEYERAKKSREAFRDSVSESELDQLRLLHEKSTLEIKQTEHDREIATLSRSAKQSEVNALSQIVEKSKLGSLQAEFDQEIAEVTEAVKENDLELATEAVEKRTIRSPIDGVVVQIDRQRGEWVTPGERVLRVIRLDTLRAECYVGVKYLSSGLLGAPVVFTSSIDGEEQTKLTGRVVFVSPEVDPVNAQVRVWAEIDNTDLLLRPGIEGSMVIRTQPTKKAGTAKAP